MGMLATGSGAAFSSAAFNDQVNPSGDMRAIVEEDSGLLLEPGISLRDGSSATDSYDTTIDPTSGKFAGAANSDFFSSGSPGTGNADETGADVGVSDLPAAFVSNDTNGDISIKVAVKNGNTATFDKLLQVTNNSGGPVNVGVDFYAFGVDTNLDEVGAGGNFTDNGGAVNAANVPGAYNFNIGGTQISTDAADFASLSNPDRDDQEVSGTVTVSNGSTEQIDLVVDYTTAVSQGSDNVKQQINNAANVTTGGSGPFSSAEDTVQLVESIRFGTDPDIA
jgi:hypothetical protein